MSVRSAGVQLFLDKGRKGSKEKSLGTTVLEHIGALKCPQIHSNDGLSEEPDGVTEPASHNSTCWVINSVGMASFSASSTVIQRLVQAKIWYLVKLDGPRNLSAPTVSC